MGSHNSLAPILTVAAKAYANHDSIIGSVASNALSTACTMPIVKTPHMVKQCKALQTAYRQHNSELNSAIELLESTLHWNDTGATHKGAAVQQNLAFVELVGPTGMTLNDKCRIGLLLQNEHALYPNHKHAAEELYLVISGTGQWSKSNAKPINRLPGEFIHHESWEPHSMTTTDEPTLSIWCWTGSIDYDTYAMV